MGKMSERWTIVKMADHKNTDPGADFKLERYKYILQEIYSLNDNVHKYLSLFQTLVTAIIGGGVTIFISWKSLNISAEVARVGIQGLLGLLIILTLFVIFSILAGAFTWFDYRNEEVELLDQAIKPGFRKPPKAINFWRWHETYLLLFIMIVAVVIYIYVQSQIIPLIR